MAFAGHVRRVYRAHPNSWGRPTSAAGRRPGWRPRKGVIPRESPSKPRKSFAGSSLLWSQATWVSLLSCSLASQLLSALGFVERNEHAIPHVSGHVSGQLERWQGGSLPESADAGSQGRRQPGTLTRARAQVPPAPITHQFPKSWLQNCPARVGMWGEAPGSPGPSAAVSLQ